MSKDYIGNLRAMAGVNYSYISEQDLQLICLKYDLTEDEIAEMRRYCDEHMISVYEITSDTTKLPPKDETIVSNEEQEPSIDHIVMTRKLYANMQGRFQEV